MMHYPVEELREGNYIPLRDRTNDFFACTIAFKIGLTGVILESCRECPHSRHCRLGYHRPGAASQPESAGSARQWRECDCGYSRQLSTMTRDNLILEAITTSSKERVGMCSVHPFTYYCCIYLIPITREWCVL